MSRFIDRIDAALRRGRKRPAFVQGDRGYTCREAERQVSTLEQWIVDHCQPGDRIAALTRNRIEALLLEWATYRTGCVWLGIPARERDPWSLARLLEDFTPKLLVLERFGPYGDLDFTDRAYSAREIPPPPGIDSYWFRTLERSSEDGQGAFSIDGEPILRLRYTSGSAGEPKAIAYVERTLSTMLEMISEKVLERKRWTVVHGLPITWASGSLIAPALLHGGKNVILETWDAKSFVRAVAEEKETPVLSLLTPGLLAALNRYSEDNGKDWAKSLRRVVLAGGPTPVWTIRRAWPLFSENTEFFVALGQTEASFPITWHPVTKGDFEGEDGPSLVPLGAVSKGHYQHRVGTETQELLLKGEAVAPARWDSGGSKFQLLAEGSDYHGTGDRVRTEERSDNGKTTEVLHYLGRIKDPWSEDAHRLPAAADAIEAVLNECPGVHRSRVGSLECGNGRTKAAVTVQPLAPSFQPDRLRKFFDANKADARLGSISLEEISIGQVQLTLSGKVKRAGFEDDGSRPETEGPPASPAAFGTPRTSSSSNSLRSVRWGEFDFSRIAAGPLYFYVGAGLSTGAGLAGWGEMVSLIWIYQKYYEKKKESRLKCPEDKEDSTEAMEEFLDDFVEKTIAENRPGSASDPSRSRVSIFGRVALLNMLLRYRGPRVRLRPEDGEAVPDEERQQRARPGEEPSQEDLTIHSMIWRCRCHGVFTTNYDMLLEHAFSLYHHGAALRTYRHTADYLRFILSNPHFVLKLHGDINDIATMELYPKTAWSSGRLSGDHGESLKEVYKAALDRGHVIYLGCGFRDVTINHLHEHWTLGQGGRRRCRIAVLSREDLEKVAAARRLNPSFAKEIEFLSVENYAELKQFMEEAVSARTAARERAASCPEAVELHRQLFLAAEPSNVRRIFSTEPWTCRGAVPAK